MGYFCYGHLAQSLDDLVFQMKVGDVSDVIRTKQGFVILTVTDRLPTCAPTHLASETTKEQANPDFASYVEVLKGRIYEKWNGLIPKSARFRQGGLTVEFSVQRDGSITARKVSLSSGDADLDKAALNAIDEAAPFPPLPISLKQDHVNLRLRFLYNPIGPTTNDQRPTTDL